jgi:DNA-binding transcriptional MerR regulator
LAGTKNETALSIGDLARRSGVPVSTIRTWEQRYGLLAPARTPGGHRRFSEDDLRRITAMRQLVIEGVSLAAAAERVMGRDRERSRGSRIEARPAVPAPAPLPTAGLDPNALEAAYRATRALLHIRTPEEAVEVLIDLVTELGGEAVLAEDAGLEALPLDLSLGARSPLLATVDRYSIARLQLERVLPTVVEDARRAAATARRLSRLAEEAASRR